MANQLVRDTPAKNGDSTQRPAWHTLPEDEVLAILESSAAGLSLEQARQRLVAYGHNQIQRCRQEGVLTLLWRQINNSLIWVLLGSAAIAMALGKMTDGLVVLSVVLINAVIGFLQEFKAGKAIASLTDMVPQNATVMREGRTLTIAATDLVPGDVVLLAEGDSVPADMRLFAEKNLRIDEAALTGESLPVAKTTLAVAADAVIGDRSCMAFSGTLVTSGRGSAVVVATGMKTELGRISDLLEHAVDLDTPLTQKLGEISRAITIGIILISAVILVIGIMRALHQAVPLTLALKDTLIFAIALAVGAIPEGLPAVVTIALAIGVQRMARRNAIIRYLPAVETLGGTTVICSDKTGTLTCNEMTVVELMTAQGACRVSGSGYEPVGAFTVAGQELTELPGELKALLSEAVLCNDASLHRGETGWAITGDPTEAALLVAAAKAGLFGEELNRRSPRLDVIPFSSDNQYMATLHDGEQRNLIMKGSPETIITRCQTGVSGLESEQRIMEEVHRMGALGMRVLAVAKKTVDFSAFDAMTPEAMASGFVFSGLIGMLDPPRPEAIAAINACQRAGIAVKMITGDHRATALAIGTELQLNRNGSVVTGVELSAMDGAALQQAVRTTHIFARVAPEHKLRIVEALQREHQIVAMTGDGVNDAPSLKQANIGVAMGISGTAVSRESADIVLADDNFASIAAAVEEGRRVYDNLIKSLAFLLPTNLGLALILIYGIMFFPFDPMNKVLLLPMLPAQLLWINLIAAVALALPLAFEVKEPDIMNRPPRPPDAPLFSPFVIFRVVAVSVLMTAGTIVVFNLEYRHDLASGIAEQLALAKAQTMAVNFVVVFQIFYMIQCRSLKEAFTKIGFFSNPIIFWGIGVIVSLQALFIYLPFMQRVFRTASLPVADIALTAAAGFVIFPLVSLEKKIRSLLGATK